MARKSKEPPRDGGISSKQAKQIRSAIRQIWSWSYARRLVVRRCETDDGFSACEQCGTKVAKVFVDHIEPAGDIEDGGYFARMFVGSKKMQGLCKKCHAKKTKEEREESVW